MSIMDDHVLAKGASNVDRGNHSDASTVLHHPTKLIAKTSHARLRIANPNPEGIFAFASTIFILSLYNINARGVHTPDIIIGMTIFTGGLLQFIAGMWQFPRGDVFGATVFSIYGAFWMSYSMILLPGTGILASYSDSRELGNAMGIYFITWFVVTIFLSLPTIRRNFAFTIFLSILSVTFLCLAVGEFTGGASATRGGGVTGIMTAIVAYYIGISELLAAEPRPIMKLPQGHWYA